MGGGTVGCVAVLRWLLGSGSGSGFGVFLQPFSSLGRGRGGFFLILSDGYNETFRLDEMQ